MTDERFSLRYGYEEKPEHPIFDEAPKRLRFFIVKSLQKHIGTYDATRLVSEVLCHPELMLLITTPGQMWTQLFPFLEKCKGWEVYNLIEPMCAGLRKSGKHFNVNEFETELNQLFGEESIGWRLKEGKLERTLPVAAREQVDAVFKELGTPRFATAFTHVISACKAYNARPQRGYEVCYNVYTACESVAKEVFGMPTATFGDVLKEAGKKKRLAPETISTLEKTSSLAHNHFRHGMTDPFALGPSEVDFVYLTCLAGILLFVRLP